MDWTIIVECPDNGTHIPGVTDPADPEHFTVEIEATNAAVGPREAVPIEACPCCGAELTVVTQSRPTEVLD